LVFLSLKESPALQGNDALAPTAPTETVDVKQCIFIRLRRRCLCKPAYLGSQIAGVISSAASLTALSATSGVPQFPRAACLKAF